MNNLRYFMSLFTNIFVLEHAYAYICMCRSVSVGKESVNLFAPTLLRDRKTQHTEGEPKAFVT